MKKTLIYAFVLIIIVIIGVEIINLNKKKEPDVSIVMPPQSVDMCYQYSKEMPSGYFDRAFLEMHILGDKVTGEYSNLPSEKDSKVGTFEGTVGPMDPKISARLADVWWNSTAEGMNAKEQLNIKFGEGSAVALFGEMVDRGDGTYVYKDAAHLTPGFRMSQTSCELMKEMFSVEKYVRDNIKTIVKEKPVLGGTWYATVVYVNPSTKTGTMKYEDGHIQKKTNFRYKIDKTMVIITLI